LAGAIADISVPKAQTPQIERRNIGVNRPHRVVRRHVILDPRRQQAQLVAARAGFERSLRHAERIGAFDPKHEKFLPSLCA
jgi:hypothetical protein